MQKPKSGPAATKYVFLLNTPSGGTPPAPHLAHCSSGQRQADEVELEVEIGSGSGEVSQVLGGWFGQAVLHFFTFWGRF